MIATNVERGQKRERIGTAAAPVLLKPKTKRCNLAEVGMAIGLNNFRQASGGLLLREIKLDQGEDAVRQSRLSRLASRLGGWVSANVLGRQQPVQLRAQERMQVKQVFLNLLRRAEGDEGALRALEACSLPCNWADNDRPLTNRQVKRILDKAQEFRQSTVRHNDGLLSAKLAQLPGMENRDLRSALSRAVKMDLRYGSQRMTDADLSTLSAFAENELLAVRLEQCQERFPALSRFIREAPQSDPLGKVALNPATLIGDLRRASQELGFQSPALSRAFEQINQTTELLGRLAWTTHGLKALAEVLERQVRDLEAVATELCNSDSPAQAGQEFHHALCADIDRQVQLLHAKSAYVNEMRLIDPLTDRSVKHNKMVWMQAGQSLLRQLDEMRAQGGASEQEGSWAALGRIRSAWVDACLKCMQDYDAGDRDLDALRPIAVPEKGNRDAHPVVQAKRAVLEDLRRLLSDAGFTRGTLNTLFSKNSLARAERAALAGIHTWQPLRRDMPVMRDGALRIYQSEITPAHHFDRRLGVETGDARIGGVSSGFTDSAAHARSLKISRLLGPSGQAMTTVIGHGVLDMWGIKDEYLRGQANRNGAKEVLELALSTNARLMGGSSKPYQAGEASPQRLVHVSVNLISPDSVRERLPGLRDYKEKTYTFNQFQAFEANSGPSRTLRLLGGKHQNDDETMEVDVETITFSFGINGIATGTAQHFLFGAWANVHEHNTRNMIKLVGDLGNGRFGAVGARPGGFIGEVYDRLQALQSDPDANSVSRQKAMDLMAQLRGQTDLVRSMFTQKVFRTGNGDTAKMGREILVLQGLAERALDLVGATDLAATMSKGCKSDKDRGGVMDVELKSKLILQDLGAGMNPDDRLQGDDQGVYYTVSSGSGQLENQRWNTGLAGSKEARHLKARLPGPEVRQFLCGLGKFARA